MSLPRHAVRGGVFDGPGPPKLKLLAFISDPFWEFQHGVPKLSWSGKYHIQMSFRHFRKIVVSASKQQFFEHLIFVPIFHHFGDPSDHKSDPISTQKPPEEDLLGPICKTRFWVSSRTPLGTHGELQVTTDGQIQAYSHIYRYIHLKIT